MQIRKAVVAYSGGLDTSVIIHWLRKEYNCEIIAFCADVGQNEDLSGLEKKALSTGANKYYQLDLKEEFVRYFVWPMLQASAVYESEYLLGTSIARPLIAKKQVEIAQKEKADVLVHGATGKGNDQVRFELTFMTLAPNLKILAPWRVWEYEGRNDLIEYAQRENIPITVSPEKPYSIDSNLLHTSYEGGILEDAYQEPNENMFQMTQSIEKAPNQPYYLNITFEQGIPIGLNGTSYTSANQLLQELNNIAGKHGIGRVDIVENRLVGIKSRGVYETPGGSVLYKTHKALEHLILDKNLQHLKDEMSMKYARLVYNGKWFSPERESIQAFMDFTQKNISGEVRCKLHKGNIIIVGRKSQYALYNSTLASFEAEKLYNPKDAEGFINIYGLDLKYSADKNFTK